jgi:succinate-semialdehyde dehydrogenase/glutarate-semialdehyde dehydrogenase
MVTTINPYDQSVVGEFATLDAGTLKTKIDLAGQTYQKWKKTSFAERREKMLAASVVLTKNKERYARTISMEMGKILPEAIAEVEKSAAACKFFADRAEEYLKDVVIATEARKSLVSFHPTGAILAVMPWNFPFWQVIRFAAPALMAGNVGLLKHASSVTSCSLLLEEVFTDAGFPTGAFQSLVMDTKLVEQVLAADVVQGVALTGSEDAGGKVASIASRHIKRSVLELGGSDPFIVLKDADLELTVKIAAQSRMQNAGQSCISAKRFIVAKEIHDDFLHRFAAAIKKIRQGNPLDPSTNMGPVARVDLAETLEKQLNQSINAGAGLEVGGQRQGSNFQPTLIDGVKPGMAAFDEETFGPLAAVITANDEAHAIELANNSRFGLGASVWTTDRDRGEQIARQVESGSVFVNALMKSDQRLPFGGVKKSGYGRELSELGIKEFVNAKAISIS